MTLDQEYPLHYAAGRGLLPVLKHLVEIKGYDINEQANDRMKWTPLHYAAYYNKADVVSYLVEKNARRDLKNISGRIPFDMTSDKEIQKMLVN